MEGNLTHKKLPGTTLPAVTGNDAVLATDVNGDLWHGTSGGNNKIMRQPSGAAAQVLNGQGVPITPTAMPTNGSTLPFTAGGAYTELAKKANATDLSSKLDGFNLIYWGASWTCSASGFYILISGLGGAPVITSTDGKCNGTVIFLTSNSDNSVKQFFSNAGNGGSGNGVFTSSNLFAVYKLCVGGA